MIQSLPDYPIKRDFSLIREKLLQNKPLALEAPTGSGKTTLLPVLLHLAGMSEKKILITQPRRIAAKNTAERISMLLGTVAGETAGYRVRGESNTTAATVIEVVTEGWALAMMQADPFLSAYSWVILDEFHERHLEVDLLLAFIRDLHRQFGPGESPSLILMSATWQGQPVERLDEFSFHSVEGRLFPVEKILLGDSAESSFEAGLRRGLERALGDTDGKILVFLPGRAEINAAAKLILKLHPELVLSPLHGGLNLKEQTGVLEYSGSARQVILATSVAETSLTIEGVTAVIDSGLERMPMFQPSGALTRLVTRRLSRATAEQRAGRAGRLGPGICCRLWSPAEDAGLIERWDPEILTGDLSSVRLQAAVWGGSELPWLTPPAEGRWLGAEQLLQELDALDDSGKPTDRGMMICRMPLPPRLAHMVLDSEDTAAASLAAALLAEGLPSGSRGRLFSDLLADAWNLPEFYRLRKQASEIERLTAGYRKRVSATGKHDAAQSEGTMLAHAFPDRIGRKSESGNYILSTGAVLYCPDTASEWAVFPEIIGSGSRLNAGVYEPASIEELRDSMPRLFRTCREVRYRAKDGRFSVSSTEMLGKISCRQLQAGKPGREEMLQAISEAVKEHGLRCLPFNRDAENLILRLKTARDAGFTQLPDPDETCLSEDLNRWLMPFVIDRVSESGICSALEAMLEPQQRRLLDSLLPKEVELHPGRYKKVDYSNPSQPSVSARMQEFFGLSSLPAICDGKIRLTAVLLSPAMRPLQLTSDLDGFWKGSYAAIRAEMRGRYPKHYWPDNPADAAPSLSTGKNRPD